MAVEQPQAIVIDESRNPLRRLLQMSGRYAAEADRQRAATIALISLIFGAAGILGGGLLLVRPMESVPGVLALIDIGLGLGYLLAHSAASSGRLRAARALFTLLALATPAVQSIPFEFISPELAALAYVVPIFTTAFLLDAGWTALITASAILLTGASITMHSMAMPASVEAMLSTRAFFAPLMTRLLAPAFLLGVTGLLSWLVSANIVAWARSAERRADQLEAAGIISKTAATAPTLRDLLAEVVVHIREVYGFYHAQVFLLDAEGQNARLEASTGRAGEALLMRGHSLRVGSQSIIGLCTESGQPVVVNDVQSSSIHRPNELLPATQAELALPLLVGGEVIGALDVQSTLTNAFQAQDVRSLEVMAIQLAASIDKARLVDELQARAAENERLYEESQSAMRQLNELNRRLGREGWQDYLSTRRQGVMGYTLRGQQVEADNEWTPTMRQALGSTEGVTQMEGAASVLALPVRVRGDVIGVLEVERTGERSWSQAELELAQTLVDQLAVAIENARLYESARQATEREHVINRIGQDIQSAQSVDEVLRAALAELGGVLGASHGMVQLVPNKVKPAAPDAQPAAEIEVEG